MTKSIVKYSLLLVLLPHLGSCQTTHKATLSWPASTTPGATYEVLKSSSATGTFTVISSGITALTFVDSGLAANTQVCYQVVVQAAGFADSAPTPSTPPCGTTNKDQAAPVGSLTLTVQ